MQGTAQKGKRERERGHVRSLKGTAEVAWDDGRESENSRVGELPEGKQAWCLSQPLWLS